MNAAPVRSGAGAAAARRAGAGLLAASLALVSLVPAGAASAAPAPAVADGRNAATAMARLFAETCLRHAGDADGLRAVLSAPRFRRIPPDIARAILPKPGLAFDLPGSAGHLMVLSFDDGWCGEGGTGIDPGVLTNALSGVVGAGGTMKLMGADPDGREQRYLIERPHRTPVALLVLLMPADREAGGPALMQASLFASEMRPGQEPMP